MTQPVRSADGNVQTDNNCYWIAEEVSYMKPGDHTNGMVVLCDGGIAVLTGTAMGAVGLRVELYDEAPPLRTDGWDEVVEFTAWSSEGELRILESSGFGPPEHFPVLATRGEGGYRIRVHAKDRDSAFDRTAFEPLEHHLILAWPTDGDETDATTIFKQTDQFGARRRSRNR